MTVYSSTLRDQNQAPIAGAKIYVYTATGTLDTLTNPVGGGPLANPVTSDEFGNFSFVPAADGAKTIDIFLGGVRVWKEVAAVGGGDIPTLTALAQPTGAGSVGATGGGTVQSGLDARPTAAVLAASGGAALVGSIQSGAGAVARTVQAKLRDTVSVKDFGAVGDGVADDTSAINAALASGAKSIIVPAGTYKTAATIALSANTQRLVGEGAHNTTINIVSNTASAITIANGVDGASIRGLSITRTGVAGAGAHGIQCLGSTDRSELVDLIVTGHFHGLVISTCDTGLLRRVRVNKNLGHGIFQTNVTTYGPSQWEFNDILADQNAGDGIHVESAAGPAGLILGSWNSVKTFANSGRGIHILGSATTPVFDLRADNCFLGSDQLGCIRIHSFGGKHRVSGFFERAGRDPTGPTLATPAGNAAPGIEITANNIDVNVSGAVIDENSYDGIQHDGGLLNVSGCVIYNNGRGLTGGRRNGILSNSGTLVVGSSKITNLSGGTSQLFGVATGHENVVINADLSGNATADTALAGSNCLVVRKDVVSLPNAGEVRVGGNKVLGSRKTGWATATGTATRTTFDTATVTLPQLAERVKALIDDLHSTAGHGAIGA